MFRTDWSTPACTLVRFPAPFRGFVGTVCAWTSCRFAMPMFTPRWTRTPPSRMPFGLGRSPPGAGRSSLRMHRGHGCASSSRSGDGPKRSSGLSRCSLSEGARRSRSRHHKCDEDRPRGPRWTSTHHSRELHPMNGRCRLCRRREDLRPLPHHLEVRLARCPGNEGSALLRVSSDSRRGCVSGCVEARINGEQRSPVRAVHSAGCDSDGRFGL